MEFSKIITVFLILFGVVCITASFILAFLGKDTNDAVTIAAISQLIVSNVGYLSYQYRLKDSRNKYRVDANGIPFEEETEIVKPN